MRGRKIHKERDKALAEAERQEHELQRHLEQTLREHKGVHDAEIKEMERQLAEAQTRSERAKSMVQLTKVGHVYILSNIGSFGENIIRSE